MSYLALLNYLDKNKIEYRFDGCLADLVSMRVGGIADLVVYPASTIELVEIVRLLKNCRYFLLGNGTNCYFTSKRYHGAVIVTKKIKNAYCRENLIYAECGVNLTSLCYLALSNSLCGLEFANGIPASVGGAVFMNASAFGGMISNLLIKSVAYDIDNDKIVTLNRQKHIFSKKFSVFRLGKYIHLSSEFLLEKGSQELILEKMQSYLLNRQSKQPLNLPNSGSVFVNPDCGIASKMIDECGLKGLSVGGAQVSTKHAGFIVNLGNATSDDVNNLIDTIKKRVYEKYKINLKQEIIYTE